MGSSPLTVELAEIQITELETITFNTSPQPPSLYKHFVDDGFEVFRDKTHAETYLEYVNSLSNDLVYTNEHPSQNKSIPFLDILIHKDLSTSVYRKPTQTRTLIVPQLPHRPPKTPLLDPSPVEHITSVPHST